MFRGMSRIDARTNCEAVKVYPKNKTVDLCGGKTREKSEQPKILIHLIATLTCLAAFAGCATTPRTAERLQYAPAASILRPHRVAATFITHSKSRLHIEGDTGITA